MSSYNIVVVTLQRLTELQREAGASLGPHWALAVKRLVVVVVAVRVHSSESTPGTTWRVHCSLLHYWRGNSQSRTTQSPPLPPVSPPPLSLSLSRGFCKL